MVVMRNILCYDIMWIYVLIRQKKGEYYGEVFNCMSIFIFVRLC